MSKNTWNTVSWPPGYIDNNLDMPLKDRPCCTSCNTPLRKQKEIKIEGTIKHRGRHLCEKCYQIQLDSGEFSVRAKTEQTDTHIRCMACKNLKPIEKFKRLTGTFRVRRDYTCALCRKLWERYKLTYEQYKNLLVSQDYKCAICKINFNEEEDKTIDVDHDHACCLGKQSCGKCVRGLLCGPCNRGIGLLKDSPAILRQSATYLEGYNERTQNRAS